jgi:phosphoadenosine phosphosulfate reductase
MAELPAPDLEQKAAAVRALLGRALEQHGRVVYANSLGAEAMVLTDIIWTHLPQIDVFSIDTGRLHEETYALLERLQRRYQRTVRVVYPDAAALERLVARQGVNGFYHSIEARLECCRVRKIEPCTRAIQPGESRRAGRWWWERAGSRECGLHPPASRASARVAALPLPA